MSNEPNVPGGRASETNQQIKKLPCDHIFHKSCLRSWFQRQQTCPTCRTSILRLNPNNIPAGAAGVPLQPQQGAGAAPAPAQNNIPPGGAGSGASSNAQTQPPIVNPFARTNTSTAPSTSTSPQRPPPLAPQADIFNSMSFQQPFALPPFCKIYFI